uniref:Uncharacterized protein n=1 Tax=Helicotheca tamesis TaxID=374047 RepID=A0A7S2N1K6_9STRA|mmetsp:Transcript_7649/g.10431  ORF Transcript_7649/g.10431 Transcript_7649/m.10431 type:complete len:177 (+) Transcript_7649:64-594(+)
MKLYTVTAILVASASAFAPTFTRTCRTTSQTELNLFGGKKESGDGGGKAPGMMDQLAMLKKAQEIAQKKATLDKELATLDIVGESADGNVKCSVKYIPAQMPKSPEPYFDAVAFDIDESYLESASCEELSAAVKEAYMAGEVKTTEAVAEKYKVLQEDLGSYLGSMGGGAPAEEAS